jgi:hypothetical protein
MVGWFDRVLNPTWHKIRDLTPQESFEVSVILLLHGYLRMTLRDEFCTPFEKLCDPRAPESLLKGSFGLVLRETQKLWPIKPELRERLVDEIELGFLACSIGKPIGSLRIEIFSPETMVEAVGCLALAVINNRLGRKEPAVLSKTGYSQDPDECIVQVLLSWMRLTGIQNPKLPGMLSHLFFEERWKVACDELLGGVATGINRNGREMLFTRAQQDCGRLSPMGTAVISTLVDRIAQKRMGRS